MSTAGAPDALAAWQALIGVPRQSPPLLVDQAMIDAFAACTLDPQPIHLDPAAGRAAGLGGTVAHGFLSLSLLAPLLAGLPPPPGLGVPVLGLNLGFDRVRFITPLPAGSSIHLVATLADAVAAPGGRVRLTLDCQVFAATLPRPVLAARWLVMLGY